MTETRVRIQLDNGGTIREVVFLGDPNPALPVLAAGEIWHNGWDIPTRWAIDGNGDCWFDMAHGATLERHTADQLIALVDADPNQGERARVILGRKPRLPAWAAAALAAGWTPPPDWNASEYE